MINTRLHHLRGEEGLAIVTAIILMAVMLVMGLGAMTLVDAQSRLTANQRQRETSFNVAEAALNAQITQISQHWAGSASEAFLPCPGATFCPSASEITSMVPSADSNVPITWKTNVYDNSGTLAGYFADSAVSTQCACDANGDMKVWVRAQATVRNHTRVVVSLVQEQMQAESVPHAALVAGALTIENNGRHSEPIIDANGGLLAVRCSWPTGAGATEPSGAPCMGQPVGVAPTKTPDDWNDLLSNQISGFQTAVPNYPSTPTFSADQIARFIATAKAESSYYDAGCPPTLTGHVVVNITGNCSYTGSTTWNSQADPGFLIFLNANSSLSLGGNTTYNGIIYHANLGTPQSSAALLTTSGNTLINGGVIIDGPGRMLAGESGMNIHFDDHGYDSVQSLAAAGIIQNSWREIRAGL
jgi:Tfp pilus assembly protein PilX